MKGIIKSIVKEKNFGFILSEKKEYFFHRSDFSGFWDDLVFDFNNHQKIEVTFDFRESEKGPRAANVRRTDFPNG